MAETAPAMEALPDTPMGGFQPTQIPGMGTLLTGLRNLRLPGSALPQAPQWSSTRKHIRADLADEYKLRRAMVQRIVLGPPVALGGRASSPDLPEF